MFQPGILALVAVKLASCLGRTRSIGMNSLVRPFALPMRHFCLLNQSSASHVGVLTGKAMSFGGSNIRPEATGYGLIYYVAKMLEHYHATFPGTLPSFKGARVLVSGSGNVAQFAALKLIDLGATVLSLSDSTGALISTEESVGFRAEDIHAIAALKLKHQSLTAFVQTEGAEKRFEWHAGKRPWTLVGRIDIALPCATQNELNGVEAHAVIAAGAKIVAEGSNMGCTLEAIEAFEKSRANSVENITWYAPGKASKYVFLSSFSCS